MPDEEVVEAEEPAEEVAEEVAEEPAGEPEGPTEAQVAIEAIAKDIGWNPDHQGDRPAVSAEDYIRRSREIQDTQKAQNRSLKAEVEQLGAKIGTIEENTTAGFTFEVVSITDLNTLVILPVLGTGHTFVSTDAYTINETIQAYAVTDDIFDLILDREATGTSESNTFVQSTLFDTVVNVRQGKIILPFTQNQAVTASGASVTVVRQPDTIAT